MRMGWDQFRRALRQANPGLILLRSATTRGAMVYLRTKHPDADHRGLWEIMAVPSPTFYKQGLPRADFLDDNGKWCRGWETFFALVKRMRDPYGKRLVRGRVPSGVKKRSDHLRRQWAESLIPDEVKVAKRYQKMFRPMRGSGDPLGGKRETNTEYSFGPLASAALVEGAVGV